MPIVKAGFDFSDLNETDVREAIIRPFLHELGYAVGTDANIRTEHPLRYARLFLGRKKPEKDPELRGRADYIMDVIPGGRWVAEAKPPNVPISIDDIEQAYTYAVHAEIAAALFLVTNGRDWQLFQTLSPRAPLMQWSYEDIDNRLPILHGVLGPSAIRRHAQIVVDLRKPLAIGLPSTLPIRSGEIVYEKHVSNLPMSRPDADGSRNSVSGGGIDRNDAGEIVAQIEILSSQSFADQMTSALGWDSLQFRTTDEYISTDREKPTIATNVVKGSVQKGSRIPPIEGLSNSGMALPFSVHVTCFTEAVGFVEDKSFNGTFVVDYDIDFEFGVGMLAMGMRRMGIPNHGTMRSYGYFNIKLDL